MKLKIAGIRKGLLKLADKLAAIDQEAAALHDAIPDSPGRDQMHEGEIPEDVATAMEGQVEILRCDRLQPAIELARAAARLNNAALRREWRETQETRRRALPKGVSLDPVTP